MSIFANIMSLYRSQSLNNDTLFLQSTKLINNHMYTPPVDKPILVHVWGTWCPVCRLEAGNIERLSKYYEVVTIAVNSGSDYEIHKYLQENKLNFKVINDQNGLLAKKFNVAVYPTTFIYNKDKKLIFSDVGYTTTLGLFARMLYSSYQ